MKPLRTAILVESTEHGRALLPLLPDWSLEHDLPPETADEGWCAEDWAIPAGDGVVVTLVHADRCGIDADVVVRGDGGVVWPLSIDSFPRPARFQGDKVMVVDMVPTVATGACTDELRGRVSEYDRLGWDVA
jgi:hypothetical protein